MPKPADLEAQLAQQLRSVQAQAAALVGSVNKDGPTADQQSQLQKLMEALKQIETQQKELQAAIKSAKADREAMFDKERDFFNPSAKEPPAPNMEELRDNNVLTFLEDDQNRRKEDFHKAKPKIIPSGGLAGFRVAPDLMNMDFAAIDPNGD